MENDTYHLNTSHISKSGLDAINHSPAMYKYKYLDGNIMKPTRDMYLGSALHAKFLEPTIYWKLFYPQLTSTERQIIDGQSTSIKSHPAASILLRIGASEVIYLWNDPTTGADCKLKADFLPEKHNVVVDIKRMKDVSKGGFRRSMTRFRYDVQAAFYLDGLAQTNAKDAFIFICVEPTPPFRVAVYQADNQMIEKGREQYKENLKTYVECQKSGQWPSYQNSKILTL